VKHIHELLLLSVEQPLHDCFDVDILLLFEVDKLGFDLSQFPRFYLLSIAFQNLLDNGLAFRAIRRFVDDMGQIFVDRLLLLFSNILHYIVLQLVVEIHNSLKHKFVFSFTTGGLAEQGQGNVVSAFLLVQLGAFGKLADCHGLLTLRIGADRHCSSSMCLAE